MKLIRIENNLCIYCEACCALCPEDALKSESRRINISQNCSKCGICASICPCGAIKQD
ncbi:MAG: 4Fe-4S dicluster domain-containing protein [Fibrobacterota bacterium]